LLATVLAAAEVRIASTRQAHIHATGRMAAGPVPNRRYARQALCRRLRVEAWILLICTPSDIAIGIGGTVARALK
jgi:hypothetical protein